MPPNETQFGLNPFNPEATFKTSISSDEKDENEQTSESSFEILRNPEGREALLSSMDDLINYVRREKTEVLVFLDKSARPLAWLFRERFKHFFPEETLPAIRFINIGTEKSVESGLDYNWQETVRYQDGFFGKFSEKEVKDRLALQDDTLIKKANLNEDLNRVLELRKIFGNQFSRKKLTVVDEIGLTGESLRTAIKLFSRAFPNSGGIEGHELFDQDWVSGNFDTNKELMPWFKNPGLIGVFDIFNDQALLAKRVDKNSLEEVKNRILHEKEQSLNDLKDFISGNYEKIKMYLDLVKESYKKEIGKDEGLWRNLEWIEKMMSVTTDEGSTERDRENWLVNGIGEIPGVVLFLMKYENHSKRKGREVHFGPLIPLLMALRKQALNARRSMRLSAEIVDIESTMSQVRKLRDELKILAKQES